MVQWGCVLCFGSLLVIGSEIAAEVTSNCVELGVKPYTHLVKLLESCRVIPRNAFSMKNVRYNCYSLHLVWRNHCRRTLVRLQSGTHCRLTVSRLGFSSTELFDIAYSEHSDYSLRLHAPPIRLAL